ncbi:hypothetical protein R1flu_029227 [Riccia fluitans]|uniref:DDE Tnp4 domain-containing protein n=1 Tax=Riccia fluitans TaxID=41844 RepID=A0ABD1XNZ1_9MARC
MLMVMSTSILCIQLALEQNNLVPPVELLKSEDMHMIDVEAEDDPMRMSALSLQIASMIIGAADIRESRWWVTRFKKPVPVEIRVGASLHRLVLGHTYFHVGDRFGLGESTVQELMEEVIHAIITMFGPWYAMERWLMIPYHIVPSSPNLHVLYNARHTAARICMEQAFQLLKGRFKLLEKGIGSSVRWAAKVVHACCILQNILIKNRVGRLDFDVVGFRASGSSSLGVNHARPGDSGGEVRTALAEYVALTPWEG